MNDESIMTNVELANQIFENCNGNAFHQYFAMEAAKKLASRVNPNGFIKDYIIPNNNLTGGQATERRTKAMKAIDEEHGMLK